MNNINNDILKYLTNPHYQYSNNNIEQNNNINDNDKKFYRKRILSMGKEIYGGKDIDDTINKAYDNYVYLAINYCKMLDKKDIIQSEYSDLDFDYTSKLDISFNINDTNNIIINNKPNEITLDNFVNITSKTHDTFVPRKRNNYVKQNETKTKAGKKKTN